MNGSEQMQPVRILHLCKDFVAVDKPAGVLLDKSSWKLPEPPPPTVTSQTAEILRKRGEANLTLMHVHQLDRATSGCMMFARNSSAAGNASISFQMRRTKKQYRAVVEGYLPSEANEPFIVDLPLARCPYAPLFEMVGNWKKAGRAAVTEIRVVGRGFLTSHPKSPVTLVQLELLTGRRHQLRLHLAALGHPIVGDPLFNNKNFKYPRMLLHSLSLEVPLAPPYTTLSIKTDAPFRPLFAEFNPNIICFSSSCKLFPPLHSFDTFNRCYAVLFTLDKAGTLKLLLRKDSKKNLHKRTFLTKGNCWSFSTQAQVLCGDADVHQALAKALGNTPFLNLCMPSGNNGFTPDWSGLSFMRLSEQYRVYSDDLKAFSGSDDVLVTAEDEDEKSNIVLEEKQHFDIHRVAAYIRGGREDRIAVIHAKPYIIYFIHVNSSAIEIDLSTDKSMAVNGGANSMVVNGNPKFYNRWLWTSLEQTLKVAGKQSSTGSQDEYLTNKEESLPLDQLLKLALVYPGLVSWLQSHEKYNKLGFTEGRNLFDLGLQLEDKTEGKNFTSKIKRAEQPCTEIEIGLFLGTIKAIKAATQHRGITHSILCGPTKLVPEGLKYLVLDIPNDLKTSAEPFFPSVIAFIRQARQQDGRVLVCSDSGQAVTLIIGWLINEKKLTLSDALDRVTERGVELPNTRFLLDLSTYENQVHGKRTYEIPIKRLLRYYKRTLGLPEKLVDRAAVI